ncbi:hypothetical protein LCGC14_1000760 [marine sediment metagenome]|uniref:Uncharacterized protein n=1 Tax=marine sediment metagenome TaxID=412755 RepID=A0A0F9N355_9ZZZZ
MVVKKILEKFNIIEEDRRSPERIKHHYVVEKALAKELKAASRAERKKLYIDFYDELFKKVLDHPQLTIKENEEAKRKATNSKMHLLKPYLNKSSTFLEIGAGDCAQSFKVAKYVKKVIAVDVSAEITKSNSEPENFTLVINDGSSINVPEKSIDVIYSNQLMEHLHPEDAIFQLKNTYKALKDGGSYICITPHRFSGPHDVSKYFDDVATGFHLKEYSYAELYKIFKDAGFGKMSSMIGRGRFFVKVPIGLQLFVEKILMTLPKKISSKIAHSLIFRLLLGIKIIARKQS